MLHKSDIEEDIATYIKERVPAARIETIFDVGSNIGWVTLQFLMAFPECEVWAFEPVASIHAGLKANLSRFPQANPFPRAHCVHAALGERNGTAIVSAYPEVTVNRILSDGTDEPSDEIPIYTGDQFCLENNIEHIHYLKIDAEGYDFKVLQGLERMLTGGLIDFIQVEASMHAKNHEHTAFEEFSGFLSRFGFSYFRFTNQASDHVPILSRADVVFIRDAVALSYRDY